MEEQKIKELIYENYRDGFHCAEAIVNAVQGVFPEVMKSSARIASGLCGGIAKCKQDICGALSGGVLALGLIYGRDKGGENINKLVYLSAELRNLFIEEFGSTVCKKVIENIENRQEYNNCQDVTATTAELLVQVIKKNS